MISDGNDYEIHHETLDDLPMHDFIIVKDGITVNELAGNSHWIILYHKYSFLLP
jgi:hypothetical protein